MKCAHCLTNAGRTTKGLECCELRMHAQSPKHIKEAIKKDLGTNWPEYRIKLVEEARRLRVLREETNETLF